MCSKQFTSLQPSHVRIAPTDVRLTQTSLPLQLHYVMDKQAVKRGHILTVEARPCMGIYFILEGQVWLPLVVHELLCISSPMGTWAVCWCSFMAAPCCACKRVYGCSPAWADMSQWTGNCDLVGNKTARRMYEVLMHA